MVNSLLPNKKHFVQTNLLCAAALCSSLTTGISYAQESLLQKEISRRADDSQKAQELLLSGDNAYNKQDYEKAVEDYSLAFGLFPNGLANTKLRAAAAERYATAATERSRRLAKFGKYDEAKQLLTTVLNPRIAPSHLGASQLLQQLDDPIRNNPALSSDHVDDVIQVGRLLREGEGFYNLGQYDEAERALNRVLNLDPYNTAARRSMEKINIIKSKYYDSARDQTRAQLLSDVDKNWSLDVPDANLNTPEISSPLIAASSQLLENRLADTVIENIDFEDISLDEAIDYIRIQSRLLDTGEQNGINIVVNLGDPESEQYQSISNAKITIRANNLPISVILKYITEQTNTQWTNDGVAVKISPIGSDDLTMISRSFKVPPTFLSGKSASADQSEQDIFSSNNEELGGKLVQKISIKDFLKQNGVTFPEGSSAQHITSSNTLIVRNTRSNIDLIDRIVSLSKDEEPIQIVTRTTIIRITEEELKELGFDWLISGQFDIGDSLLGGGSNGSGGVVESITGLSNAAPVSASLRSGSANVIRNSIDQAIAANDTGDIGASQVRAPGIPLSNRRIQRSSS